MASHRLPQAFMFPSTAVLTTQQIAASTSGAGAIFIAPKAGNIAKVGVNVTAKTGTAPTYRFGVEGVSAGNRSPDGTYKASGAAFVDQADPATGWSWFTLGTPAAVAAGDEISATARYQTGTIDGTHNITVGLCATLPPSTFGAPYPVSLSAGTWSVNAKPPVMALQYDDGTVIVGGIPTSGLTNDTFNNSTSPIYRGNSWTPGVNCRVRGFWLSLRVPDNADFKVDVFRGSDPSPFVSVTVRAADTWSGNSAVGIGYVPIPPTIFSAGTTYRFVVEPTTANSQTNFIYSTFPDANAQAAMGGDTFATTGVAGSPPAWTDYNTSGNGFRLYPITPDIDQVLPTTASRRINRTGRF